MIVFKECQSFEWRLWQCPPFLFLVMGFITIISMIAAALLTSHIFPEPEIPTITIVSFIAILFLTMGNVIIGGFNKLAEANRIKLQFISIISHQLRTPVSIFKWTLESLQQTIKRPELANDTETYIFNLLHASQRMIHLVNTLLDVTRIEARTLTLQVEDILLGDVIKKLTKEFQRYADASHTTLAVEIDTDIPVIRADRQRITMVMETFIDNAIRYTPGTGAITIILKKKDAYVRFSVSDTGVGIPAPQQKNIFQKFFRATNIMQYQTEGTGIDLFISHYVVHASGGTIGFNSTEGKGSTFWFTLPIK